MTGALLRNRIRTITNYLRAIESAERLRLAVIFGLLAFILLRWTTRHTLDLLELEAPGELREAIQVEAYRLGVFLAALVGFTSFGTLWRSSDSEVLNRLPLPPASIFHYRLSETLAGNLPFLLLALAGFFPLCLHGEWLLALESTVYLLLLFFFSTSWSLYWHIFAGASVVTPRYKLLKNLLAGKMVMKDRTLLLYSPFLGACFGFAQALLSLTGLSAISRGESLPGGIWLLVSLLPCLWTYASTKRKFVDAYYPALAALAEGELLGEMGESAPGSSYLGISYVERLPSGFRPLVARDLRQAWRRSRLDHFTLLTATAAFALLCIRHGAGWRAQGYLWPAIWGFIALGAASAFRLTRQQSDAPWLWLSLPLSLSRQYLARGLATLFFSLLMAPALLLGAIWSGENWLIAALFIAMASSFATISAANLALTFFTERRIGGTVYFGVAAIEAVGVQKGLPFGLMSMTLLSALTFLGLKRFLSRLSQAGIVG